QRRHGTDGPCRIILPTVIRAFEAVARNPALRKGHPAVSTTVEQGGSPAPRVPEQDQGLALDNPANGFAVKLARRRFNVPVAAEPQHSLVLPSVCCRRPGKPPWRKGVEARQKLTPSVSQVQQIPWQTKND